MAPMMLDPSSPSSESSSEEEVSYCSDPTVVPSRNAPRRVKELWNLHGGPHSKRYSNPKLVSLAALVRHNASFYQGQKAFLYPTSSDPQTSYHAMTWDDFDRVTESIATIYGRDLEDELRRANLTQTQPTVALIGRGITLEYFCTELALQKLGIRVLLLAESNALDALHHLLETCNACAVITDQRNAKADTNGLRKLRMVERLPDTETFSQVHLDYLEVEKIKFQDFGDTWERHSFIIHSSGSTGMPKPIVHTNRSMMQIARVYRLFQEFTVENWFLLFPLYHIAGISTAIAGFPTGQILSFPPLTWPPSSSTIFAAWKTMASMGHPVDIIHCAPTIIENMYDYIMENGEDFTPLIDLTVIQPGGAKLSDRIVTELTERGCNVKTTYGSTEIGPTMRPVPHTKSNPNCYSFKNLSPDNPFLKMEEVGENLYECIVFKGFEFAAELWVGKSADEPYRTNDLFFQDPPGSGYYVLQGRKDDVLVHSNGENTTAGSLQLDIQASSRVIKNVVAFGHSRPLVSLLVEVNEDYDPSSPSTRESVWETVNQINRKYPGHSRIMDSMIHILPRGSTLPVTPKGNVKRKEAERIFTEDVERLYANIESPSSLATSTNNQETLSEFLRNLFADLANIPSERINDWTTLYDLGIDSRLAIPLRTSLSSRLGRPVSLSTIFENPSISTLVSKYESPSNLAVPEPDSSETINRIICKLESEIKTWPTRTERHYTTAGKQTILLTGASGSLGTAMLQYLSGSEKVEKIYAMVRGPNPRERLIASLEARKIKSSLVTSDRSKIQVLDFSMQDALLGQEVEVYYQLATQVTTVVQNAWKMDFNQGVEHFEDDCIRIERVLQISSKALQMATLLLRVGQMSGSTQTGHWNSSEMWPILFSTSAHPSIAALPDLPNKTVDWIPVDIAAATISALLCPSEDDKDTDMYAVHNITNPHSITWSSLLGFLQSTLAPSPPQLEIVSMQEWVARLNAAAAAAATMTTTTTVEAKPQQEIQGLRLLQFFENMVGDVQPSKIFETQKTQDRVEALRACKPFCRDWLEDNVKVWRESGFIA
ncbi:male sterility protein [Phlyctema vagabunda]|uniref:Male sterility protein n=1 Tax=Phlyctema vagabunda TaxID=108571 RepID=A0ABR4PW42_9HELO